LLCGREAEVRAILENCAAGRFTVLLSPPGFGASSVLRAGVQPPLLRAGTIVAISSDWEGSAFPIRLRETIAAAVHDQTGELFAPRKREPLIDLLKRARATTGKPIAILLDQFEEYLRCHRGTGAFEAELSHAISSRTAQFVIAMHPSAAGEFERLSPFIPNLLGYTVTLPPLNHEAAAELVSRRGAEPASVNEIISARVAAVEGGVHPSLITIAALSRAHGTPDRVILTSLDPVLNGLRSSDRRFLAQWVPILVTTDGHRIAVSLQGLTGRSSANERAIEPSLAALVSAGVLRRITTPYGIRYLLARDAAAPVLRNWSERMQRVRTIRQQTFLRAISVIVGLIALTAAYLVYYGRK
jgi:hypothetical protein